MRWSSLITGIKFDNSVKNMNHSQFINDTLLMGGASSIIAQRFKTVLEKFILYFGGLINHQKGCIYGWNANNQTIHSIANIFGVPCKLNWDHFNYLGMAVSAGPLKDKIWNIKIDKMKRKVQQWGSSWINIVGHLFLLKSGLSSLPLYHFTLLHAPAIIHLKFKDIIRQFLWQGGKDEKKIQSCQVETSNPRLRAWRDWSSLSQAYEQSLWREDFLETNQWESGMVEKIHGGKIH